MSMQQTCRGDSVVSGRSPFVIPYPRATAVVSLMSRRGFSPAMRAASKRARRWMSVYHPGTAMTTSESACLSSVEAISRSLPRYAATSWVKEKVLVSPR